MLYFNSNSDDKLVFNFINDVIGIVNKEDSLRKDVDGYLLRVVVFVEDKNNNFTSFSLETKDL